MREYIFTIEYSEGAYPLADTFIRYPELYLTAVTISMSRSGLWRVDRVTGPEAGIAEFKDVYTDPSYCIECGGDTDDCDAQWEHEYIETGSDSLTVYSRVTKPATYCHSVPFLALNEFGDGLLFDSQRRGHNYEWRILMPEDLPVGDLFDRLRAGVEDNTRITLQQVKTPSRWGGDVTTIADLPYEQRVVLETAVVKGYYATPRRVNLGELAAELDLPNSTLRYRLRRAEARLIESFIGKHSMEKYSPEGASKTISSEFSS